MLQRGQAYLESTFKQTWHSIIVFVFWSYLPSFWTHQSIWQRGQRLLCLIHKLMQHWWKLWLHSPQTTTQSLAATDNLESALDSAWQRKQASITCTLQIAQVSHSTSQLHIATAFHFFRVNSLLWFESSWTTFFSSVWPEVDAVAIPSDEYHTLYLELGRINTFLMNRGFFSDTLLKVLVKRLRRKMLFLFHELFPKTISLSNLAEWMLIVKMKIITTDSKKGRL